jgi:uncharacterized protein YndB with AHSA1/START domain
VTPPLCCQTIQQFKSKENEMTDITIKRTYPTSTERVWELWTTPDGIEQWWAPDGFQAKVAKLELEVGGELHHSLTATAPNRIEFMNNAGLPLTTHARKRFTEVEPGRRLVYVSQVDFVPGGEPYDHVTTVEFSPQTNGVRVVMTIEPMHDDDWTQRLVAGRENELDNLGRLITDETPSP